MKLEPEIGADQSKTLTVFVSYSRDDERKARTLVSALEGQGFSVWWDGLIDGGSAYADRIQEALTNADAVVVLWSNGSSNLTGSAMKRRSRATTTASFRSPSTVPNEPLGFRQFQCIDLSNWHGRSRCSRVRAIMPIHPFSRRCRNWDAGPANGGATLLSRRQVFVGAGTTGALVAVAGAGFYWLSGGSRAEAARIAVLPFQNLSGDPKQDYFSDGLAEELRATLSQTDQLEVAAQTSSESFRDLRTNAKTMAKALNVAYLIEGSVRRSSEEIRVSTRIVDGHSGFDKWSNTFDRKAADSLAVQSDIAAFVTDAIVAGLDKERPSERIGGTKKPDAFDAFLRGAAAYRLAAGQDTDLEALKDFDRAIAIDPAYAAARAARSRALTVIANNYAGRAEIPGYYQRAIASALSAIRLAPRLAEGYSALGFVLFNGQLDARGAAAPYQRSFELGYGNAEILSAYANFAGRTGRFDDGREAIARAQSLDPLNPSVFRNAGFLEYSARDFVAADHHFQTALSMNPKASNVHAALGDIALVRGDLNGARAHFSQERDRASQLRGLAIVDRKMGQAAAAEADYAGLIKEGGDTVHYQQAQVLAQWGRKDEALAQLEQAFALRDAGLVRLRNDPLLDPVRVDARFVKLEKAIGFA